MRLQPSTEHPHGGDGAFDTLFTGNEPMVAHVPRVSMADELTYRRTNHRNLHVRGYKEEGTTTTPFDMAVFRNDLDHFHLVADVADRVPALAPQIEQGDAREARGPQGLHPLHGEDMPEVRDWVWRG